MNTKTTEVWSEIDPEIVSDGLGQIKRVINVDAVKASIDNILRTRPGERCFVGSTKIALLNGRDVEIQDLVDKGTFWVYSLNLSTGRIEPGLARAMCTGYSTKLVRILLDTGEEILCTPEHLFMLRNGHFCTAQKLVTGTSLMPLYQRMDSDGYFSLYQPFQNTWERAHRLVMRWKFFRDPSKFCVHHKDFDKKNNVPENLLRIQLDAHIRYHSLRTRIHNQKLWYSSEFQWYRDLMQSGVIQRRTGQDPEFRKAVSRGLQNHLKDPENAARWSKRTSDCILRTMAREDVKEILRQLGRKLGKRFWSSPEFEEARKKNLQNKTIGYQQALLTEKYQMTLKQNGEAVGSCSVRKKLEKHFPIVLDRFGVLNEETWETYRKSLGKSACGYPIWKNVPVDMLPILNHKILEISELQMSVPVYDLYVEKNHNFALSSGVFVHNCMLPQFGSPLHSFLFETMMNEELNHVVDQLKAAVELWDDRVEITEMSIYKEPDKSRISIDALFRIKGNDQIFQYTTSVVGEMAA